MNTHYYSSLSQVLDQRADDRGDQLAFTFLVDGEHPGRSCTYAELRRTARRIAGRLRCVCQPGERALLLFPAGLEFVEAFFGCLYAGLLAVPTQAPRPARRDRSMSRLQAIAANARPAVVLTTGSTRSIADRLSGDAPALAEVEWLCVDADIDADSGSAPEGVTDAASVALLQYTSGSTAEPRGVMVTHANLLHNLAAIQERIQNQDGDAAVSWLPAFHDMGLIGGILLPVFTGMPAWIMSPTAFLQRPVRWLQAISRFGGTFSGGPNFSYDLCLRRTTPEQRAALDLSRWRYAFNGAEPVRYGTLAGFADGFAASGFRQEALRPVYGLAESTVMVSGGAHNERFLCRSAVGAGDESPGGASRSPNPRHVGCGKPVADTVVRIVHPENLTVCAEGMVGEIWVRSPSVGAGYWEHPQATARTFAARLPDGENGAFLRTGDLGFLTNGELFVTARLKDLIVVRGRKLYPQDLESTVELCHSAVRPGGSAAFSLPGRLEEVVVIIAEVEPRLWRGLEVPESESKAACAGLRAVLNAIRDSISAEHEVQLSAVWLIAPGELPRTTSGKVRRSASRETFVNRTLSPVAAWPEDPVLAPSSRPAPEVTA